MRREDAAGFTLIELVVVMGLLTSFLLMLVQLLGSGVEIFQKGERGQDLADRADLASRALREAFAATTGPTRFVYEPQDPDARLVVDWHDLGWPRDDAKHPRLQVVRATVRVDEPEEQRLIEDALRERAQDSGGSEDQIAQRLAELVAGVARRGRADLLLLVWPQGKDGVFLEVRKALFAQRGGPSIMDADLGGEDFPAAVVPVLTQTVVSSLLHFEVALWSPETQAWAREPGNGGPEEAWDSARAGRFALLGPDAPRREVFGLDVGGASLRDVRDDVFPRWVRITAVVAAPGAAPEALLDGPIDADQRQVAVNRIDRFPDARDPAARYLKIGREWIAYDELRDGKITGVKRGQRGTLAESHVSGSGVRAGYAVVVYVPLEHGRDG